MPIFYQDFSSYFWKTKALFGCYPTQDQVNILTKLGVKYFVDLTVPGEVRQTYTCDHYINFPIVDRKSPTGIFFYSCFIKFLQQTIEKLNENQKIYIHCRGGHGRSGVVVASLLCRLNTGLTTERAIFLTTKYHNDRLIMRQKWRDIGSPQTRQQKSFVSRLYTPLMFCRASRRGNVCGFSLASPHVIKVPPGSNTIPPGSYPNAESAFLVAANDSANKKNAWNVISAKKALHEILLYKFHQHHDFKRALLDSSFRPIIYLTKQDKLLRKIVGEVLQSIREDEYNKTQFKFGNRKKK